MKYNTETMQKIAQQIAEMVKTAVVEQIETEQGRFRFGHFMTRF